MSLLSIIRGGLSFAASVIRSVTGFHPSLSESGRMLGIGRATKSGVEMDHMRALAIPAIFRAVSIISAAMLKVPFYVFQEDERGSKTWDKNHEAWTVIHRKAHANILAPQLRETMTAWALMYGNAVAKIERYDDGSMEMVPLLPDRTWPYRVSEDVAKSTGIAAGTLYYVTRIDGQQRQFEASECFHLRGLGINPFWGVDIFTLMIEALAGAAAAAEYGYNFWGQGANPAGFIEMPGGLDEEGEKNFRESIRRSSSGLGNAHKLMVLEEGSKFNPWSVDPKSAQFLQGKEFDIRILAMIVGIKVHKLIDSANNSYNSLEMSDQEHKEDDLLPWYCRWSMEYSEKTLTEEQKRNMSHSVGVDDEQMEWVPFQERASGVVELYNNGLITKDEGRRRVNFGRSRSPNANRYRIPSNIIFEDQSGTGQVTTDNPGDPTDETQ